MELIRVEPQPHYIESSGRWCWTLPEHARFPGCCTEVVTASREWWEYAPSQAKPHPMAEGVMLRDERWYWAVPVDPEAVEHSNDAALRIKLEQAEAAIVTELEASRYHRMAAEALSRERQEMRALLYRPVVAQSGTVVAEFDAQPQLLDAVRDLKERAEQAEAAYAELNVRLAGVEVERDMFRVALANEQGYSKREAKAVAAGDKALIERADAAEARVRELEQEKAAAHDAVVYPDGASSSAANDTPLADEIALCVEAWKADHDRLRGMWDTLREFMGLLKTEGNDSAVPAMWAAGWTGCREAVAQKMDDLERGE